MNNPTSEMFLIPRMLEARTRELERLRFVGMKCIAPFTAMPDTLDPDAVHVDIPEKIEGSPLNIGDEFIGLDRYLWAQKTITLPEHMDGHEVYGLFDFGKVNPGHTSGFESMMYVDGKPFQGVDTNHNDVNFESLAGKTVEITFLLWSGRGNSLNPNPIFRHLIQQADVGYLHTETDELYYLAEAIIETLAMLDDASTAKHALTAALERAFNQIDWDRDYFYETVGDALASLKADLAGMKKDTDITINCVGHTHIDVAWLWRLKHTREKAQRSFATVLKLMNEFPEYIFLQTQPQLYDYIKTDRPDMYEEIKKRVAEGRWEADGGMWLEADCNLSSGEALTRQFLYGMRMYEKELGQRSEYLWLPDVFGYSWALPQILKGCGINTFMTTKISWNQYNTMPHDLFKWRGIDGSEVMTYFITTPGGMAPLEDRRATYNGVITARSTLGSWIKFRDKNLSNEALVCYGYGDGGGGVNRNMLKMRRALDQLPGMPNIKPARAGDFFRRVHEKLDNTNQYIPVWDGELYLEFHRGTYTSQAWNKMMNRRLEFALAECEWISQLAKMAGGEYDQDTLVDVWHNVLRNQFHDIIPGSSINEVYKDCHVEYGQAADQLRAIAAKALETLTTDEPDAYTLWHFGSFPRKDLVLIEETREGSFRDASGNILPAQKAENGYWVEVELPALSMQTIRFTAEAAAEAASPFAVDMAAGTIKTPFYEVAWDENGDFTRLYDIENRREVITAGAKANVLEVYEDKPLNYENWDIDIFHMLKHETVKLAKAPELVESGALPTVIRFEYAYRNSTIVHDVVFYADDRRIDFKNEAEWHDHHRVMKALFPVAIRSTKATYDIQYGHVERPTHFNTSWDYARFEVCAHKWADYSEDNYGVSILNDCKYGHSVHDGVMTITLLRAGTRPDLHADQGHHSFTYSLLPHAGSVTAADTIEESVKLNLPVRVTKGAAAQTVPTFTCSSRNVAIDAVKKAEDGDALIVRVHECRGGHVEAELKPGFAIRSCTPCNLLEEVSGETVAADTLKVSLKPFEIQTWKIELA